MVHDKKLITSEEKFYFCHVNKTDVDEKQKLLIQ